MNFAFDAPWIRTTRDHAQWHEDMKVSIPSNNSRGAAPFAFMPRLALAPFFKWSMVMCDYMHANTVVNDRSLALKRNHMVA
jgi:hypothetical protein